MAITNEPIPAPKFLDKSKVMTPYGEGEVLSHSEPSLFPRGWSYSYYVKIDKTGKKYDFFGSELKVRCDMSWQCPSESEFLKLKILELQDHVNQLATILNVVIASQLQESVKNILIEHKKMCL